jgi:hypothetical protein
MSTRLVHGVAGVPLDAYDAIELLAEPAQILATAARTVADLWNDPPLGLIESHEVREQFPALAAALDELLGGGPMTPPLTLAACRASSPETGDPR